MSQILIFTGIEYNDSYHRPAGAYRIRTALETAGYSCTVVDFWYHLTQDHIEKIFEKYVGPETLWVGFSTTFFGGTEILQKGDYEFWEDLKAKYNTKFVIGGPKTGHFAPRFFDIEISGYADDAVVALSEHLYKGTEVKHFISKNGGITIPSNIMYDKKDLSNIPIKWKDSDGLTASDALPFEVARGCIFQCAFCNFPHNGKKKFDYIRAKEDMKDEFIRNYEQFGTQQYLFLDDTFNDSMYKLELMHDITTSLPFKINFDTYIKPELLVRWPDQIPLLIEAGLRGTSIGIESYNRQTRKAINKGHDVETLLEHITELKNKSNGQVKNSINIIIGLPHESIDMVLETREKIIADPAIDNWNYHPLAIHSSEHQIYLSPIDKDPEKYGYTIVGRKRNRVRLLWKNEYMNSNQAFRLGTKLNIDDAVHQKIAGWNCGSTSSMGVDIAEHYANHDGYTHKLPWDQMKKVKAKRIHDYISNVIK